VDYFKPTGVPLRSLEEQTLYQDEREVLRLADLEGLYHEEGAERMGISRATFGRILDNARRKAADAIINGKALRVMSENHEVRGETNMPGRDGTGPRGKGRGHGHGHGPCGCGKQRGHGGWNLRNALAAGDEHVKAAAPAATAPGAVAKTGGEEVKS